MSDLQCWNCGQSLAEIPRPISRHEQCPQCFEALHCCRLCRHYRTDSSSHCDEERAEPPVIKENANFCDWFRPDPGAFSGKRVEKSSAAADKLNALFGDSEAGEATEDSDAATEDQPRSSEEEARTKLDDLFKD